MPAVLVVVFHYMDSVHVQPCDCTFACNRIHSTIIYGHMSPFHINIFTRRIFILLLYQGFLQTVSNLFDVNNLRDFTQLQKVYLDISVQLISLILVSSVDGTLEFILNLTVLIEQTFALRLLTDA